MKSPEVALLAIIANYEYNNQFRAYASIYFNPFKCSEAKWIKHITLTH